MGGGEGHGLYEDTIPAFTWREWRNLYNISAMTGNQVEFRTRHLTNTNLSAV